MYQAPMLIRFSCASCAHVWEDEISPDSYNRCFPGNGPDTLGRSGSGASRCPACLAEFWFHDCSFELVEAKQAALLLCTRANGREVLAVSRRDDHTAFGLPGGKADPGETPVQALIRESKEEMGLVLREDLISYLYSQVDSHGWLCHTFTYSGDIPALENQPGEGVVAWVPWGVLFAGPFGSYNRELYRLEVG